MQEVPDDDPKPTRFVWRFGMDIRSVPPLVKGSPELWRSLHVVEEWPGREGTCFFKLAGDAH